MKLHKHLMIPLALAGCLALPAGDAVEQLPERAEAASFEQPVLLEHEHRISDLRVRRCEVVVPHQRPSFRKWIRTEIHPHDPPGAQPIELA